MALLWSVSLRSAVSRFANVTDFFGPVSLAVCRSAGDEAGGESLKDRHILEEELELGVEFPDENDALRTTSESNHHKMKKTWVRG